MNFKQLILIILLIGGTFWMVLNMYNYNEQVLEEKKQKRKLKNQSKENTTKKGFIK